MKMRALRTMNWRKLAALIAATTAACGENLTRLPSDEDYAPGVTAPLDCAPNLDGRIDARELPTVLAQAAGYLVSPGGATRAVDLTGAVGADGSRVWDWSNDDASDGLVRLAAVPVTERWYAASFPNGQFAAPLDAAMTLDGVYARDVDGLVLLGLASREKDPPEGRTLWVYDPGIELFRFPLRPGDAWTSTSTVTNGLTRGLPYAGFDTYAIELDAVGELALPHLAFSQVHRMRTQVTVAPAIGAPRTVRQTAFLFECFGEVARATSRDGETSEDFTTAAEIRRLGLR